MAIPSIPSYDIPELSTPRKLPWRLNVHRAALLIHDMQNYFVEAYSRDDEPISSTIANIQHLLSTAEYYSIPVYYTAQPPSQSSARRGLLNDVWGHGIQTPQQAAIISELSPQDHAFHHVVTKWRYSAFNRTDLKESLHFSRRDQLMITGVYGHMGCMISAADAFMNDIQPFLIHDAIADFSQEDHALTSQWVGTRSGVSLTTEQAIEELTASELEITA